MLHLVLALVEYCHATNFDAGRGERLLKDFFKELARNSQQRGQAIFTEQLAKRMFEKQLIQKAMDSMSDDFDNTNDVDEQAESGHLLTGSLPGFIIEYDDRAKGCSFRWLGSNKHVHVHPVVLSYFGKEWDSLFGNFTDAINCYTELAHSRPIQITKTAVLGMTGP
jgi:hypothetical protein